MGSPSLNSFEFMKVLSPDKVPVSVSLEVYIEFIRQHDYILRHTNVGWYFISTVFLPFDHSFGEGPSIHFESMVFDTSKDRRNVKFDKDFIYHDDLELDRYHTYEEAIKGHCKFVVKYRKLWSKNHPRKIKHLPPNRQVL